jgi:prolipoprotein diacylglyceryltransferase
MVAGGGKQTTAWYGLQYAGQAGKRVPVPLIQAFDSFVIFGILMLLEHYIRRRPTGFILSATAALWGLARFFEENVFLKQNDHNGAPLVQGAGLALFVVGVVAMAVLWRRRRPGESPEVDPTDSHDDGTVVEPEPSDPADSPVEV